MTSIVDRLLNIYLKRDLNSGVKGSTRSLSRIAGIRTAADRNVLEILVSSLFRRLAIVLKYFCVVTKF